MRTQKIGEENQEQSQCYEDALCLNPLAYADEGTHGYWDDQKGYVHFAFVCLVDFGNIGNMKYGKNIPNAMVV